MPTDGDPEPVSFAVLGWPPDAPTLTLDHEQFSYAGKFVMSNTAKAVARDGGDLVAAAAFDTDRTDATVCRLRYLTVRADRRGEGIGARLARFVADRAAEDGFDRTAIAVNNPFAYEALYKAGFAFTGETTGLAELVLDTATARDPGRYREGLDRFRDRDLSAAETRFLADREGSDPPPAVDPPA